MGREVENKILREREAVIMYRIEKPRIRGIDEDT